MKDEGGRMKVRTFRYFFNFSFARLASSVMLQTV